MLNLLLKLISAYNLLVLNQERILFLEPRICQWSKNYILHLNILEQLYKMWCCSLVFSCRGPVLDPENLQLRAFVRNPALGTLFL